MNQIHSKSSILVKKYKSTYTPYLNIKNRIFLMDFSFGITTAGNNDSMIQTIIDSIRSQNIPNYEILIIGQSDLAGADIKQIPFNESTRDAWITRKKNIVAQEAKYDNLVLLHDYVMLEPGWYEGFLKYGNSFIFCSTKVHNIDGSRYIDYAFHPFYVTCIDPRFEHGCLLPYSMKVPDPANRLLYISGSYYIIKRQIALALPLDEGKTWGQGEDLDLSFALTSLGIPIQCNAFSSVKFLKNKRNDTSPWIEEIKDESLLERIKNITHQDSVAWLHSSYAGLFNTYTLFKRLKQQNLV